MLTEGLCEAARDLSEENYLGGEQTVSTRALRRESGWCEFGAFFFFGDEGYSPPPLMAQQFPHSALQSFLCLLWNSSPHSHPKNRVSHFLKASHLPHSFINSVPTWCQPSSVLEAQSLAANKLQWHLPSWSSRFNFLSSCTLPTT